MAKLDTVYLLIENENGSHSVDATRYSVEKGEPFTDHVKKNPSEYTLSGFILSEKWKASFNKLNNIMDSGKVVKYVGKTSASDVIILNIQESHSQEVKNGMSIDITIRKIRITKSAWTKAPTKKAKATQKPKTKSGKKKTSGTRKTKAVYHKVKKGESYWSIAKKYNTTVGALKKMNKWSDRSIPVGAKMRVK